MTKKQLEQIAIEKYKKYNSLLWYARSKPENINIKGVKENKERIEREFPEEVEQLQSEEFRDWQHGFHSGMNAAFSYILSCLDKNEGYEIAEENFPELDS